MVDELIDDLIRTGRDITEVELRDLRRTVAATGFDPNATARAGIDVAGVIWQQRIIDSNEQLSNDLRDYLRHAIALNEWPPSTTFDEYIQSLGEAILDDDGGVFLDRTWNVWRLTFVGRSGQWRRISSGGWILVGYNQGYRYWVTGFQPRDGLDYRTLQTERLDARWLRQPS